uniref:Uncharacterized protein n=1 Tax=Tetranychus urticae TaxID=32264 RepID=A0A158P4B9_TETUR
MNSVTRMFMVSEDYFRRNCEKPTVTNRLLNTNIPLDTQIKLLNDFVSRTKDNFPNQPATSFQYKDEPKDYEEEDFPRESVYETPPPNPPWATPAPAPKPAWARSLIPATPVRQTPAKLEMALRNIPGLFNKKGEVLRSGGDKVYGSRLSKIVDHLTKDATVPLPNGGPLVIRRIRREFPHLVKHIRNPRAIDMITTKKRWN